MKTKSQKKVFLLSLMLSLPVATGFCAENLPTFELDPIIVTATKTPTKLSQVNANVNVITREEIEKNHYHDLSQALKSLPGIDMINFGDVGYESANAIRINGTDQIVVLIDGIRANPAHLSFSVNSYINMDQVERIEVIKGSTSVLYGSGAKGGVINIITRKPKELETKLTYSTGSFDKENYNLYHTGKSNDTSWLINIQKDILGDMKDGKNITIPQHLNAHTATVKLSQKLSEKADLTFAYDRYKSAVSYRGSLLNLSTLRKGERETNSWRMIYNQKFSDKAENTLSFMHSDYDYTYQGTSSRFKTIAIQEQFTALLDDNHRVALGFDLTKDKFRQIGIINNVDLTEYSLYAQDEWDITSKWKLTTGLRYTHHSEFGSHTGPNVNLSYKPTEKTNMYASYNTHYIAPSVVVLYSEMYLSGFPFILPNPNLKPESGKTFEFGISHDFDKKTNASFHVYRRSSKDVIEMLLVAPPFGEQAQNIDKETAKGWDLQFNKKLSDSWSAFIGYTNTDVKSSAYHGKNRDGLIPKGTLNLGASYQQKNYDINFEARYVIDRNGPFKESFPKNNYWLCNISANYKVNKNISAFFRVNNLFDTYYAEQTNYLDSYGTPYDYYTAPGRNFVVGVQYAF